MRKINYKKNLTTDNSKGRSCFNAHKHFNKTGLADKFKQSIYGSMVFMGLTLGTYSVADAMFTTERTLNKNIWGNYASITDNTNEVNIGGDNNDTPFYLKYFNNTNTNTTQQTKTYNNINNIVPDTLPLQPNNQQTYVCNNIILNDTIENNNNDNDKSVSKDNELKKASKRTSKQKETKSGKRNFVQHGIASHMGHSLHGRKQASGECHDKNELICAHKSLPFGTRIRVTNLKTGESVIVRVTDRGPFGPGRIVDLSLAAAKKLNIEKSGICKVKIETL